MLASRLRDIAVSAIVLWVTLPGLAALALAMKISMPGPVLYGGVRVGKDGRLFRMWKFRTMVMGADQIGPSSTAADDPRVTALGSWMRHSKVDELPQLWNVLVGDMSLVGPRPQVEWAVARYTNQERILLSVRPGITDPASLRFANEGEILRGHPDPDKAYFELIHPEKMRLSIDYVNNRSFGGDLRILMATLVSPLRSQTTTPPLAH